MVVLEQNEVQLEDGKLGFLEGEDDPITFLSIDRVDSVYSQEY